MNLYAIVMTEEEAEKTYRYAGEAVMALLEHEQVKLRVMEPAMYAQTVRFIALIMNCLGRGIRTDRKWNVWLTTQPFVAKRGDAHREMVRQVVARAGCPVVIPSAAEMSADALAGS